MIVCNCCPTPADCKERGECLNAVVVQRTNRFNKTAVVWVSNPATAASAKAWFDHIAEVVKPACWHNYGPTIAPINGIVSARACLQCGQPEF